ncbi:MAG TPA: CHASE3 domain-containing protein [Phototrophicaceae bacterium]|nr:CHASE3 domain-containing protein [Phototrophicaceae bacterium]
MLTFGRRIAIGFAISTILLLAVGVAAYLSITSLVSTSFEVTHTYTVLNRIASVLSAMQDAETGARGFVITGDDSYLEPYTNTTNTIDGFVADLRSLTSDNPDQQKRIDQLQPLIASKMDQLKQNIDARRSGGFDAAAQVVDSGAGKQYMDEIRSVLSDMEQEENTLLTQRGADVDAASSGGKAVIIWGTLISLIFVIGAAVYLTRSLSRQITSAVQHMRSSSAELQAAATQQLSGAKEYSVAMTEITTTISELVATSRQIAESAQRVTDVAEKTDAAAHVGEGTVQSANESIQSIRQQVDLIVDHMLELGKKSQQIGSILDIVSELAEQTNILSINATIEAAGAGEAGKRFAVVADEIRKLADRVTGATKDIRVLIDDVRSAVNTTIMATETGSKAVDAGSKQFTSVASAFTQIATLVTTTTEIAREIELSTKQQSTAVAQVNLVITDAAQASKENEVSTGEVLKTASALADRSGELLRLVQSKAV